MAFVLSIERHICAIINTLSMRCWCGDTLPVRCRYAVCYRYAAGTLSLRRRDDGLLVFLPAHKLSVGVLGLFAVEPHRDVMFGRCCSNTTIHPFGGEDCSFCA